MKHQERNEDAASPVVGVMLMLVVTVVIAAVITAFATGMAGDSTATTPMALLEADNLEVSGTELKTFDIVHKGGDEMSLENIQVTLEQIGGPNSGIIIARSCSGSSITVPQAVKDYCDYWTNEGWSMTPEDLYYNGVQGSMPTVNQLSVKGKSGENTVVSTGDRIKVPVMMDSILVTDYVDDEHQEVCTIESSGESIPTGVTVKWTVSDVRTTGVIAKGEFVVPEA